MIRVGRSAVALLALTVGIVPSVCAQQGGTDPNLANPTQVVTVKRDGYTIAGLVTHLEGAKEFKYGVALFPGYPGIMRLREEDGKPRFEMAGISSCARAVASLTAAWNLSAP